MNERLSLSTHTRYAGTLYVVALFREELGRRIKAARLAAGLTQQALAERIGLKHAQDVSRYERGKVEVPQARIDLIAEETERPRSYFIRDVGEPEPLDPDQLARVETELKQVRGEVAEIGRLLMDRLPAPRQDDEDDEPQSAAR